MDTDKAYSFEELLDAQGSIVWRTKGGSMRPLIRQGKDIIVVKKPAGRLKKYDVALYKINGKYLLHRILEVYNDHYIIAGDNNTFLEKVKDEHIIGVMTELKRGGKEYDLNGKKYRLYEKMWCGNFKLKCAFLKPPRAAKRLMVRIYHKMFKKGN